jgi:hypothetical protein
MLKDRAKSKYKIFGELEDNFYRNIPLIILFQKTPYETRMLEWLGRFSQGRKVVGNCDKGKV